MITALVALTTMALAGPHIQGDFYPWNPRNWDVEYQTIYEGTDTSVSWELDMFGVPTEVVRSGEWPSRIRHGVNATDFPLTVSMASNGKIKKRIRWIGWGAAPQKVLVHVYATARASASPTGSGSASNGLGDPDEFTDLSRQRIWLSSGSAVRELPVSDGVAETEVSLTAYAEGTGLGSTADTAAFMRVEIADREVVIDPDWNPTYEVNPEDAYPRVIVNEDPRDKRMNTAALPFPSIPTNSNPYIIPPDTRFIYQDTLDATCWGFWNVPRYAWNSWETSYAIHKWREYSLDQILTMMTKGPDVHDVQVTVSDSDGITRTAKLKVNVHAPASNVTTVSDKRAYGQWKRITPEVILNPGEDTTFLEGTTIVEAVTKKVMNSFGGELGVTIKSLITIKLTGNRQWGEDVTASLARLKQVNHKVGPYTARMRVWIERRGFWKEHIGWSHVYSGNGYVGVDGWNYTYWESGDKVTAEEIDVEQEARKIELED